MATAAETVAAPNAATSTVFCLLLKNCLIPSDRNPFIPDPPSAKKKPFAALRQEEALRRTPRPRLCLLLLLPGLQLCRRCPPLLHRLARQVLVPSPSKAEEAQGSLPPPAVPRRRYLDHLYRERKPINTNKLWSEMLHKGCTPDLTSYNVKVMYEALHVTPDKVQALIIEIKSVGLKPDIITYNYLITSYCKNGRLKDAKEIYKGFYEGVEEMGCGTRVATFRNFLSFLCGSGDLDAGLGVFNDAASHNKIPYFTTSMLVKVLVQEARADISEVKKRFPEDFLCVWRYLEKKLGLVVEEAVTDQLETT